MRSLIVALVIGTALTPLIELRGVIAGATAGKIIFFRALIEGAIFVYVTLILLGKGRFSAKGIWETLKHPIALALTLFLLSMAISAAFSMNPYRAFWGTIERGEGIFGPADIGGENR